MPRADDYDIVLFRKAHKFILKRSLRVERRQISSAEDDSLNSDLVAVDPKKNHVTPHGLQSRSFTYVWTKLIQKRLLADQVDRIPNLLDEGFRATRIVIGNPIRNIFDIITYKPRKSNMHYLLLSATRALALYFCSSSFITSSAGTLGVLSSRA